MHDDIDASFGCWSMNLHAMKRIFPSYHFSWNHIWILDNVSLIPHIIEEIPNFKIFLKPYMSKGVDCLVIHTKAQQFCFYMRDDGYPAMHFKILSISPIWGPEDSILMWRQYKDAKYMLSDEDRKHCKPDPMKNGPKSSKVYPDT